MIAVIATGTIILLLTKKQAAANNTKVNETPVLRSLTVEEIERDGSVSFRSSTIYAYQPNCLLREKSVDGKTQFFQYEYDSENHPVRIRWNEDDRPCTVNIECTDYTKAILRVNLSDASSDRINSYNNCQNAADVLLMSPLYYNADYVFEGIVLQCRDGSRVSSSDKKTVEQNPDGGQTQTTLTTDISSNILLRKTIVTDAEDHPVFYRFEFGDDQVD